MLQHIKHLQLHERRHIKILILQMKRYNTVDKDVRIGLKCFLSKSDFSQCRQELPNTVLYLYQTLSPYIKRYWQQTGHFFHYFQQRWYFSSFLKNKCILNFQMCMQMHVKQFFCLNCLSYQLNFQYMLRLNTVILQLFLTSHLRCI